MVKQPSPAPEGRAERTPPPSEVVLFLAGLMLGAVTGGIGTASALSYLTFIYTRAAAGW